MAVTLSHLLVAMRLLALLHKATKISPSGYKPTSTLNLQQRSLQPQPRPRPRPQAEFHGQPGRYRPRLRHCTARYDTSKFAPDIVRSESSDQFRDPLPPGSPSLTEIEQNLINHAFMSLCQNREAFDAHLHFAQGDCATLPKITAYNWESGQYFVGDHVDVYIHFVRKSLHPERATSQSVTPTELPQTTSSRT